MQTEFPSNGSPDIPSSLQSEPDETETMDMGTTDLVNQYDQNQRQAMVEEDFEQRAIEQTNPHHLFMDIVAKPLPKGVFQMTLMGRPIDLRKLEKYVVFGMSPKSTVTTLRYNEVKAYEDAQGYGRQGTISRGKKSGIGKILLIIILCAVALIIGLLMLTKGPELMKMFGMGSTGGVQAIWAGRNLRMK